MRAPQAKTTPPQQTSPPVKPAGRVDCYEDFTTESLAGKPCWGALDLAIVSDLSALAWVFPVHAEGEAELYRLLIRFWLPEETAKRLRDKVPYLQWAAAGWITLTDGDEVDFTRIEEDVAAEAAIFAVQELRYDRAYAANLTQNLELKYGVKRAEFPQTIMQYTLPAKLFERLIKRRAIRHQGNPILTWQIGHVALKSDNNENIRPVKPRKGDHRTVDGVQATVMALSGALASTGIVDDWDGTVEYL